MRRDADWYEWWPDAFRMAGRAPLAGPWWAPAQPGDRRAG
jgi:hypothetical protein